MKLNVYHHTSRFSNEEILKYPQLKWDRDVLLRKNFSIEELRILGVGEDMITCIYGTYEEILKLDSRDNHFIYYNENISPKDKLKYFHDSSYFTELLYGKYGTDEEVMKLANLGLILHRKNITLELLSHFKLALAGCMNWDICQKNFMKHFMKFKEAVNISCMNSIENNLSYQLITSDVITLKWMTFELAMDIKCTFDKTESILRVMNAINFDDAIIQRFPLKDLFKYGIDKIDQSSVIHNPDINNIIHYISRDSLKASDVTEVLSLPNLRKYFPDYILYINKLSDNPHITLKEAIDHGCDISIHKLAHIKMEDIPYDYLHKIDHPIYIKDVTIRDLELFEMKRYDHIHRLYTPSINRCYLHDVDFIF